MTENMKSFLEAVSKEETLGKKVNQARTPEEIIELAKELDVTLTKADFVNEEGKELSEEELSVTAGGSCIVLGSIEESGCGCALLGVLNGAFCIGYGQ